jgi:ankyrin repeat protein
LLPVVEALTSYGCRMDIRNKADATPLHLTACQLAEINGNTEIVQLLKSLSMVKSNAFFNY